MKEMVKCRCGEWLSIVTDHNGATIERCYRCGYRANLRGRVMDRETLVLEQVSATKPCGWPSGCDGFAAKSTDYCAAHCMERRRALGRAYAKMRNELGLRRKPLARVSA